MNRFSVCILSVLLTVVATSVEADSVSLANGYGGATWGMSKTQVDSALAENTLIYKSSRTGEISFYDSLGGLEADILPKYENDTLRDIRLIFNTAFVPGGDEIKIFDTIHTVITARLGQPGQTISPESTAPDVALRKTVWNTSASKIRLDLSISPSTGFQMKLTCSQRASLRPVDRSDVSGADTLTHRKRRAGNSPSRSQADSTVQFPGPDDFVPVEQVPTLIRNATPAYPEMALMEGVEGTVWVQVLVDREGRVREARIVQPAEFDVGFEAAALDAAMEKVYKPAIQNGAPVAFWISYQVDFELE